MKEVKNKRKVIEIKVGKRTEKINEGKTNNIGMKKDYE